MQKELFSRTNLRKNVIPISILIIGTLFSILIFGSEKSRGQNQPENKLTKEPIAIGVQKVGDSRKISQTLEFPAIVTGDQEVTIAAKSAGTVTWSSLEIGRRVAEGSSLVTIEDVGNNLGEGKNDIQSIQIRQAELAFKQAKEALDLAKKNDKLLKTDASESAKDIAELQLKSAKLSLESALDSHEITAPISGVVVEKLVSVGDSVNIGQPLATITKTEKIKFRFFVNEDELIHFKINLPVKITDSQGQILPGRISNISPQADAATKRFQIEAVLGRYIDPRIGTIATVSVETINTPSGNNLIILPLSAITVDQNENYIFLAENGKAKKVGVIIEKISGETAEISAQNFTPETQIITSGNKLLEDGDPIDIK